MVVSILELFMDNFRDLVNFETDHLKCTHINFNLIYFLLQTLKNIVSKSRCFNVLFIRFALYIFN